MGGQRTSFSKLQRDRDKKAKAAAKREKRQERSAGTEGDEAVDVLVDDDGKSELSADDLLKLIESIHQRYDAGTMTLEEFEEQKVDLLGRLPVDYALTRPVPRKAPTSVLPPRPGSPRSRPGPARSR